MPEQDMLERVRQRRSQYNNNELISGSVTVSSIKLAYYYAFAWCYKFCGWFCDVAMVNGSWTEAHMKRMWSGRSGLMKKVFPPCMPAKRLEEMVQRRDSDARGKIVLSIGQFRPEKDHILQVR